MPDPGPTSITRWLRPAVGAVARHPSLWRTGVAQAWRLRRRRWWRSRPFLPVPDPGYLALRSQTAYGDPLEAPAGADVVTYLRWCRAWPWPDGRYRARRSDRVR